MERQRERETERKRERESERERMCVCVLCVCVSLCMCVHIGNMSSSNGELAIRGLEGIRARHEANAMARSHGSRSRR